MERPSPPPSVFAQAAPGLVVAMFTACVALVGFGWKQTNTLTEMATTLKIVCQQLDKKTIKDEEQDEAIHGLRVDVEGLKKD